MKFLERDLEDIIFNSSTASLMDRGILVHPNRRRQVKIGNYGIADIVSHEKDFCEGHHYEEVTVFELKKDCINQKSIEQCIRYMRGLERYFINRRNRALKCPRIVGVVIGSSIDAGDFVYLTNMIVSRFNLRIYTYTYELDGLRFVEHSGYKLIDEGF